MKLAYRGEIDGIRAIAVLAVIINHFNNGVLPSGYLGVDVFFVISGYVITRSLYGREERNLSDFITSFYSRRVKRLIPALAFFTIITAILFSLVNPNPKASLELGIRSLFGLANIALFRGSSDYFSESSLLNPYTHTWSLGVEEQFYIAFPFLYWFLGKKKRGKDLNSWLLAISLTSLLSFAALYNSNFPAAYYLPFTRFWEIAIGCVLFIQESKNTVLFKALAKIPGIIYLCGLLLVLASNGFNPVATTVFAVLLAAGLISSSSTEGKAAWILKAPIMTFVGLRSYSAYLWHWTVLVVSKWTIGVSLWTAPVQLLSIIAISAFSYKFIESPARKIAIGKATTILLGIGLLVSTAIPLRLLGLKNPNIIYSGDRNFARTQTDTRPMTGDLQLENIYGIWRGRKCSIESNIDLKKMPSIANCTIGDFDNSKTRILVVGNSYSAALAEAFLQLVNTDRHFSATITSSFGATAAPFLEFNNAWSDASSFYWSSVVPRLIQELRPGDIVLAVNNLDDFTGIKPKQSPQELGQAISSFSQRLGTLGIKLVYLRSIPNMTKVNCSPSQATHEWFRPRRDACNYASKSASAREKQRLDAVLDSLELSQKISTIDLFDIFCEGDLCTHTAANGMYLYRDEYGHPSNEAARSSSDKILQGLKQSLQH